MSTTPLPGERMLTELDHARLVKLLDKTGHHPALEALLASTDVTRSREAPPDIVTMNSQLMLEDPRSGERRKLTLCYPRDAEPSRGFISVLSPVGASLLEQRCHVVSHAVAARPHRRADAHDDAVCARPRLALHRRKRAAQNAGLRPAPSRSRIG